MRVGIVVDNELNNDIRVLREIEILKEAGLKIYVLCFGFLKSYPEPGSELSITRINIPKKLKNILFFMLNSIPVYEWLWKSSIKKFILNNDLEFLHVHDLYMARAAFKGIKSSGKKIPLILDLHENYPFTVTTYNWTKGLFRRLISRPFEWRKKERSYLRYADRIIVLSREFQDLLISRYPELTAENFVVIPNVPDITKVKKEVKPVRSPFTLGFPVIFYYGVIAERRGVFDSLEIFTNLVRENYHVNFLLIGPIDKKDKPSFLKIISQDLLKGRIHYIPWINSAELPDYLETVDICLAPFHKNPQHESGVANKIYEYMLGKKPIIASDCLPQQTLIEKCNCGLVFRNLTEFKNEIIMLIEDRVLSVTLGKNGYEAVIKYYNAESVKENLVLLYRNINDKYNK